MVRLHKLCWPLFQHTAWLYRRTLLRRTRIIAVVGSFGKTTTAQAVSCALGPECRPPALGNNRSYVAEALLRVPPTAPWSVIEVGINGPGQMQMLARMLRPKIVIVTGVGCEHNRSLFNLSVTRYEKSRMVSALDSDGLALLNGDDPNVRWMSSRTRAQVTTFGFGPGNDIRACGFQCRGPEDASMTVESAGSSRLLQTRLPSRQQALSLLAAFAVGRSAAIRPETLIERLSLFESVQGRFQPVRLPSGAVMIRDEFKSAQETVHSALDALEEIPARRRIVILGEISEPAGSMGPVYKEAGRHVGRVADLAVFVTHNFQRYATGARAFLDSGRLINAGSRFERAVEALRSELRPGDVVLLKGRDTQRLDRIALALMGERVGCHVQMCRLPFRCARCPQLAHGFESEPPLSPG